MDFKDIIKQASLVSYPIICPIDNFTINDLCCLSMEAKTYGIKIEIKTECNGDNKTTFLVVEKLSSIKVSNVKSIKDLYNQCKSVEEKEALDKMISMMLCLRKHMILREKLCNTEQI